MSNIRLESFMHALTGNYHNKINKEGENPPYFEEHTLILPELGESNEYFRVLVAHNSFHLLYTDFNITESLRDSLLEPLVMLLEDRRIEALGLNQFPGLRKTFFTFDEETQRNMQRASRYFKPEEDDYLAIQTAIWLYLNVNQITSFPSSKMNDLFGELISLLNDAPMCTSTADCFELGKKIHALVLKANLSVKHTRFENPKGDFFPPTSAFSPPSSEGKKESDESDDSSSESKESAQGEGDEEENSEADEGSTLSDSKTHGMGKEETKTDIPPSTPPNFKNFESLMGKQDQLGDEFGNIHKGVHVRNITVSPKDNERYKTDQRRLNPYTRSFIRHFQNLLKHNEDERRTGQVIGGITQSQMWRKDGKVFQYKKDRNDEADLAITILVDESGSMGHRNRAKYATDASIMVSEVCEAMNIPLSIIGHTADFEDKTIELRHYLSFDQPVHSQKSSLLDIRAREDNRDGLAIRLCGEYLLRQTQKDKLLIIISDGEPHHRCNYIGENASDDTRLQVRHLESRGVNCVGVSIGEGHNELQRFYRNFVSVSDLPQLPKKLVKILEKYIFVA